MDSLSIAKRIIVLIESDDYEGILNLGIPQNSERLSRSSTPDMLKKSYLKLSLLIHPDRLLKNTSDATKAFQALVKAYEFLSSPDLTPEMEEASSKGKKKVPKPKAISRSNEGSYSNKYLANLL